MPLLRHTLFAAVLAAVSASALAAVPVTVYKSPSCGCCEAYIAYLKQNASPFPPSIATTCSR